MTLTRTRTTNDSERPDSDQTSFSGVACASYFQQPPFLSRDLSTRIQTAAHQRGFFFFAVLGFGFAFAADFATGLAAALDFDAAGFFAAGAAFAFFAVRNTASTRVSMSSRSNPSSGGFVLAKI